MEQIISKEELNELMRIKGEVRGMGMRTHAEFIVKEEGEDGLKRLEDTMVELGHPIKFREIRRMNFYPLGLEAVMLVAIKRLFNYNDEKFQELGKFHAKFSLIIKIFMKYFVSFDSMARETPRIWRKYFTTGDIKVVEFSEEKKYAILRVKDFKFHPLHCQIFMGTLSIVIQMMVKNKVAYEETKCIFRGDDYHEFLMKW
jgi:hypothetical protein